MKKSDVNIKLSYLQILEGEIYNIEQKLCMRNYSWSKLRMMFYFSFSLIFLGFVSIILSNYYISFFLLGLGFICYFITEVNFKRWDKYNQKLIDLYIQLTNKRDQLFVKNQFSENRPHLKLLKSDFNN